MANIFLIILIFGVIASIFLYFRKDYSNKKVLKQFGFNPNEAMHTGILGYIVFNIDRKEVFLVAWSYTHREAVRVYNDKNELIEDYTINQYENKTGNRILKFDEINYISVEKIESDRKPESLSIRIDINGVKNYQGDKSFFTIIDLVEFKKLRKEIESNLGVSKLRLPIEIILS